METTCDEPGNPTLNEHSTATPADTQRQGRPSGAQPANTNGWKHGLRSNQGRRLLPIGGLPKRDQWISRTIEGLRRRWEDAVIERKGALSTTDEGLIQTALRHERHALLAANWLRREAESMPADQRLSFSREIAEASEKRDRKLKALGIDSHGGGDDPWGSLESARNASDAERLTEAPRRPKTATDRVRRKAKPLKRGIWCMSDQK